MDAKIAIFHGDELDEYGMPVNYHVYLVLAFPANQGSHWNIRTLQMTGETPSPEFPLEPFKVSSGIEAINRMLQKLRELPGNAGLRFQQSCLPDIEL